MGLGLDLDLEGSGLGLGLGLEGLRLGLVLVSRKKVLLTSLVSRWRQKSDSDMLWRLINCHIIIIIINQVKCK